MNVFYMIMQLTIASAIPLIIVAIGGFISEKSGVTNIALEGLMVFGGFAGVWFMSVLEGTIPSQLLFILSVLVGALFGALISVIHSFASIKMKADQTISATALNLFAPAFAVFTLMVLNNQYQQINIDARSYVMEKVPLLGDIPFIGDIFFKEAYLSSYIVLAIVVIVALIINRTRFGLRLTACGENPNAADAAGINIYKMRYIAVTLSGALAGAGGVIFAVSTSTVFDPGVGVSGFGFLAIAVVIFGNWKPFRILLVAIFFGLMRTLGSAGSVVPGLSNLNIPNQIYNMIPYVATLVVLAFTSKKTKAPKALGQVYDQGKR